MCQSESQSIHHPQHLITDSFPEQFVPEMLETTKDDACITNDPRNSVNEMIKSCDSLRINLSFQASTESPATCNERFPSSGHTGEVKFTKASHERDVIDMSSSLTQNMVSTLSSSSDSDSHSGNVIHSVKWPQSSVVTDTRYLPRVTLAEKEALFYTEKEMLSFRRDAKLAMKFAKKKRLKTTLASSSEYVSDPQLTSPVSSLVNMVTGYVSNALSSLERSNDRSTITESMNTLVETLYSF